MLFLSNMKAIFLVCCLVVLGHAEKNDLEVEITQGILRGTESVSRKGRIFKSFTGIPYAKPPINGLRFQPPVAASAWKGVLDATQPHERCLQAYAYLKNDTVVGSEDCLYLNVFTPNVQSQKKLPVMVFIHGGGFVTGSASDYDPAMLLDHDVVLVTINYRLGPFGFLTTATFHLLGNDGLKDQAVAIKWVKNNIEAFGGNPDKITLFGQGAGGISAHFHTMSPLTKDLISGVIAQSGTALAHNAIMPAFLSTRHTEFLAERVGCASHYDKDKMMECLLYTSGKKIIRQFVGLLRWGIEPPTLFRPILEPDIPGAFLTKDPADYIIEGSAADVPFMTGITTDEGDFRTGLFYKYPDSISSFNERLDGNLENLLCYKDNSVHKYIAPATKSIKSFYLKNKNISSENKKQFSKMYMDGTYLHGAHLSVDFHLKTSKQPVYFYVLAYKGSESYCNAVSSNKEDYGVCHSDDLLYLFNDDYHFPDRKISENDESVIDLMTKLWVSFATHGNPTPTESSDTLPQWNPYTNSKSNYYYIKDGKTVENVPKIFSSRTKFWRNLKLNNRGSLREEL